MRGATKKPREKFGPRGTGSIVLRGNVLWIRYYKDGKPFSESAHTLIKARAEALLKKRIGEIASGDFVTPSDRRVTVKEVYQLLLDDYTMNDRASLEGAEQRWNSRLKAAFGDLRASQLSTESLNKFVLQCQSDGLANGTINRDMAALKRALNLAYHCTPRKVLPFQFSHTSASPHLDRASWRSRSTAS